MFGLLCCLHLSGRVYNAKFVKFVYGGYVLRYLEGNSQSIMCDLLLSLLYYQFVFCSFFEDCSIPISLMEKPALKVSTVLHMY